MSEEVVVPQINHQLVDDDEEENVVEEEEKPRSTRHLLNNSRTSATRSPSPSPSRIAPGPPDRALNQKFHVAALTGNLSTLQELVTKARLPIDCRDKENSTALLLSCARGHYSCAEYLLSNGADPNARRITGASPLYFATSAHHTRIVELLLKKYKAIVDLSTFDGSTPLHVACEQGFTDVVQLLIDHQANVNAKMNDGTTALMLACQNGRESVVEILVSTGRCDIKLQRLDGVTALFLVVQHGHEKIFDYLLDKIDQTREIVDVAREDGATPLFKACQKGFDSLVKKILSMKPNLTLLKNGESVRLVFRILSLEEFVPFLAVPSRSNDVQSRVDRSESARSRRESVVKQLGRHDGGGFGQRSANQRHSRSADESLGAEIQRTRATIPVAQEYETNGRRFRFESGRTRRARRLETLQEFEIGGRVGEIRRSDRTDADPSRSSRR